MKNNYFNKILIVIIFFNHFFWSLNAEEIKIEIKINDEIITNFDLKKEKNYLIALNNNLANLNDSDIKNLIENSLITEKIKFNELKKYFVFKGQGNILDQVLQDFIQKLNLKDKTELKEYLKIYDLSLNDIMMKIEIETYWNQLIYEKYRSKVIIDEKLIKEKIEQMRSKSMEKNFNLSEIFFELKQNENIDARFNKIEIKIKNLGFENTANIESISDSKNFGGKIGWVGENSLSEIIKNALEKINVGDYTKPIKIGNNYLILKINDIKDVSIQIDEKKEFEKLLVIERDKQLNRFSKFYYNKIKTNNEIKKF